MKFHCDQCKTRYSIADERVRGKILKIRCKKCSHVITVREGRASAAQAAAKPRASAQRASASAQRAASGQRAAAAAPAQNKAPPTHIEAEWFVSCDGDQEGPMSLAAATKWVEGRDAADELYVWSEGFGEWLPTEKVSHFRGLSRKQPPRPAAPAPAARAPLPEAEPSASFDPNATAVAPQYPGDERTPAPLFESAMAEMAAEAPTIMSGDEAALMPSDQDVDVQALAAKNAAGVDDSGRFEFDFSEASRSVAIPDLSAMQAKPAKEPSFPGLDGPASGPAQVKLSDFEEAYEPARPEVLAPKRSNAVLVPLALGGVVLLAGLGVLMFVVFGGDDTAEHHPIERGVGTTDSLGKSFDDSKQGAAKTPEKIPTKAGGTFGTKRPNTTKKPEAGGGKGSGRDRNVITKATNGNGKQTPTKIDDGEVDLGSGGPTVKQGPLGFDDVTKVLRRKQIVVSRCYERALKRDPLLRVPKANVHMSIKPGGGVSKVTVPSLAGEPLGTCLVLSMRRWKFPASTEGWNGRFPVVFRSR